MPCIALPGQPDARCWEEFFPKSETPIPLVIDLHNRGSSALEQQRRSGWSHLARLEGFGVYWPEAHGWRYGIGSVDWNDGSPGAPSVDDEDFLQHLLFRASTTSIHSSGVAAPIDMSRIYLTGWGSGCAMVQRAGAGRFSGLYAGIGCFGGYLQEKNKGGL